MCGHIVFVEYISQAVKTQNEYINAVEHILLNKGDGHVLNMTVLIPKHYRSELFAGLAIHGITYMLRTSTQPCGFVIYQVPGTVYACCANCASKSIKKNIVRVMD